MLKKRIMAKARWVDDLDLYNPVKRLETGYADNQPKWPYWVRPYNYKEKEWYDMDEWLIDTMGDNNWLTKNARWVGSNQKYWFRDERDRTMFILKWS